MKSKEMRMELCESALERNERPENTVILNCLHSYVSISSSMDKILSAEIFSNE